LGNFMRKKIRGTEAGKSIVPVKIEEQQHTEEKRGRKENGKRENRLFTSEEAEWTDEGKPGGGGVLKGEKKDLRL